MITVSPSAAFEATAQFDTGLAGTLGVQILDNQGNTTVARSTSNIIEYPAGSGIYAAKSLTAPANAGQYTLAWDDGSGVWATEDLLVTADATLGSTATDYISAAELAASLGLTNSGTIGTDLQRAVTAASRAIDEMCDRRFYPDADANQVRKFIPTNSGYCLIDDLCEITSLTAQNETWVLDQDYYLEPTNGPADGRPWTAIRALSRPFIFTMADVPVSYWGFDRRVTVTGKWGWAMTPTQIAQATMILAGKLFERRKALFGVLGVGADGAAVRIGKLDAELQMLLDPYVKKVLV